MIRIKEFDFKEEYKNRVLPDVSTRLYQLKSQLGCPAKQAIISWFISKLETIIIGKPSGLKEIKETFVSHFGQITIDKPFKEQIEKTFDYEGNFRDKPEKAMWLAKKLSEAKIKSCPYCNAQYTVIVEKAENNVKRKYQFDHYYPQSNYPYLSVSLYNLIPSCANCNHAKNEGKLYYHPYENSLADISEFYSEYDPDPKNLTVKEAGSLDMELTFRAKFQDETIKKSVEDYDEIFSINGIYKNHNDIAQELLTKAIIYNSAQGKSIMEIEGLFEDKATYLRYLLGNYPYEEDILKRPLAKFTQDIAKQLGLI